MEILLPDISVSLDIVTGCLDSGSGVLVFVALLNGHS